METYCVGLTEASNYRSITLMNQLLAPEGNDISAAYTAIQEVFRAGWRDDSDKRHISFTSFSRRRGGDLILATVISTLSDPNRIVEEQPEVELETTSYRRNSGWGGYRIIAQRAIMLCAESIPKETLSTLAAMADDAAQLRSAPVPPPEKNPELSAIIQSAYDDYPSY